MREYALVLLVTAAVTYLLTPLVRRVAVASRAMHAPRARDTHTQPTPLLGGLAMYGGMVAGLVVASRLAFLQDPFAAAGSRTAAGLLLAGGLIVVVGFIDDRWGLGAIGKLAGQVAAAAILVWSGQSLPWLPEPGGHVFLLPRDLSVTLTILLVVVTINAINFIDGLDGLAAGIVGVAALSFFVYSYVLIRTIGNTSQSLPAVAAALLAGMCLGFLPHNFYPARIFMGDAGAGLLGLLLAYGPISSTASLDPALLTNYTHGQALNRFPTLLPLLVPAAIFVVPYTDLMFAIIRRMRAGKPLMAADRQHLHHRLLNIGHSYRQSVLIMYLWAALFSVTVVSLSVVRTHLIVLAAATVIAVLVLLPVTMPVLRPWRSRGRRGAVRVPAHRGTVPQGASPLPAAPQGLRYRPAQPLSGQPPGTAMPLSGRPPAAGMPLSGQPPAAALPLSGGPAAAVRPDPLPPPGDRRTGRPLCLGVSRPSYQKHQSSVIFAVSGIATALMPHSTQEYQQRPPAPLGPQACGRCGRGTARRGQVWAVRELYLSLPLPASAPPSATRGKAKPPSRPAGHFPRSLRSRAPRVAACGPPGAARAAPPWS